MQHCVGGYARKCLQNETNIIELVDMNKEKSTLELGYSYNKIVIRQHKSYSNKPPKAHHFKVAKDLIVDMNNGTIPLNQERLYEKTRLLHVEDFPYGINNLVIQETIYQIYKNKKVLPAILMAADYQTMLQKSQLGEYIEEVISEESPLSIANADHSFRA